MTKRLDPDTEYICVNVDNQWCVSALMNYIKQREQYDFMIYAARDLIEKGLIYESRTINPETVTHRRVWSNIKYLGEKTSKILKDAWDAGSAALIAQGKQYIKDAKLAKKDNSSKRKTLKQPPEKQQSTEKTSLYVPTRMSGPWAVLCSLAMNIGDGYRVVKLRQDEIIQLATPFSTHSLVAANNRGKTAWDSTKKLFDDKYMIKKKGLGNGTKCSLTKKGYELGKKCLIFEREQFQKQLNFQFSLCDENINENSNNSAPTTPIKSIKTKSCFNRKRDRGKKLLKENKDIDNYTSPPPIKKRKLTNHNQETKTETETETETDASLSSNPWYKFVNDSMYGGLYTPITNNLDQMYDLTKPIPINGKEYYLYLNIDSRERIHHATKAIDIYENLKNESKILVKQLDLSCSDFAFLLVEVYGDGNDEDNIYILPKIIERKTASDLDQSITTGRYRLQKKRMDLVCADDTVLINGRKIYLLEDKIDKSVQKPHKGRVKQAMVGTECRDKYFVYYTQSKADTQRTLVNWTFMVRHWINGGYNSDFNMDLTTKLSLFKEFDPKTFVNNKSQQVKTMEKLMYVDGCRAMDAFYITRKYPNMRALYDAWDRCILKRRDDEEKKDIYNPEFMLHRKVSVFADWKFKHDLLQTQECTVKPDDDTAKCIFILKNSGFNDGRTPIAKELSKNIFSQFYLENVVHQKSAIKNNDE